MTLQGDEMWYLCHDRGGKRPHLLLPTYMGLHPPDSLLLTGIFFLLYPIAIAYQCNTGHGINCDVIFKSPRDGQMDRYTFHTNPFLFIAFFSGAI